MIDIAKFFKAYDMRGTTPELDWKIYFLIGQGLVEEILKPESLDLTVNVWHDNRVSSDLFYKAFVNGLLSKGAEVIPCGLGTTDMMYSYTIKNDISGAIVTASHNPKEDNGLKIVKKYPQMLGLESGLDKIRDYVLKHYETLELTEKGLDNITNDKNAKIEAVEFLNKASQKIGKFLDLKIPKGYTVVVDAANGLGVLSLELLKSQYPGVKWVHLYCTLDGNFPNHPADPANPDNMMDLRRKVLESKADIGIAFDGDADRVFFVDELGEIINTEHLVAVFAKTLINEVQLNQDIIGKELENLSHPLNPAAVYVVSYSRALPETVLCEGGAAIVSKQGHTFVKKLMKQYNAIYGGEASGHHYFGQFGFMDSGILAVNLMFKIILGRSLMASDVCAEYKDKYFTSGEYNLKVPVGRDMQMIKDRVKRKYLDGYISELDGISVFYHTYKFTIRHSNTQSLFRINVETKISNEQFNPKIVLDQLIDLINN